VIRLTDVSKIYLKDGREIRALDDFSLHVEKGEFVVVRGPSGSGKTTLLLTVGGMIGPSSGTVAVDGRDVYAMSARERASWRAQTVGFVFQMFHLVPYLNVLENVLVPQVAGAKASRRDALDLLERFGVSHRLRHDPGELSTGERQRVAVARALLNRPGLVLADEPTGNLDPDSAATIMDYLADYHREGGTILLVTHEAVASGYGQRTVEIGGGDVPTEAG